MELNVHQDGVKKIFFFTSPECLSLREIETTINLMNHLEGELWHCLVLHAQKVGKRDLSRMEAYYYMLEKNRGGNSCVMELWRGQKCASFSTLSYIYKVDWWLEVGIVTGRLGYLDSKWSMQTFGDRWQRQHAAALIRKGDEKLTQITKCMEKAIPNHIARMSSKNTWEGLLYIPVTSWRISLQET